MLIFLIAYGLVCAAFFWCSYKAWNATRHTRRWAVAMFVLLFAAQAMNLGYQLTH